jgi:hypothetical protein
MNDSNLSNELIEAALEFLALGYAPIPFGESPEGKNKLPLVRWSLYVNKIPTEEEVMDMFKRHPNATGLGLITGRFYKLLVLDFDIQIDQIDKDKFPIPLTPMVISGRGGLHAFFEPPIDQIIPSKTLIDKVLDIRCEPGLIIVPPSLHHTQNRYTWINKLGETPLASVPEWLYPLLKNKNIKSTKTERIVEGVSEGSRNESATVIFGSLLNRYAPHEWESLAWPFARAWNSSNNNPPLEENELRKTFESIKKSESNKRNFDSDPAVPVEWPKAITFNEVLSRKFPDEEWIIKSLIPENSLNAFSGPPATYKSYLLAEMAISCALGKSFLGKFECTQTSVMVVDEENGLRRLNKRIK